MVRPTVLVLAFLLMDSTATVDARPRFRDVRLRSGELRPVTMLPGDSRTLGEAVNAFRGRPRTSVITCESSEPGLLIPIAGNAAGSFGTFFRTELTIINYSNRAQRIGVGWLAQGQDGRGSGFSYFTIDDNTWVSYPDFVGSQLSKTGLGALLIFAYTDGGAIDASAEIDAFSRIWTRLPSNVSSVGTSSQSFPAVSVRDSFDRWSAVSLGLRHGSGFRTNAGVVNLDTVAHTWTVTGGNGGTFSITVQPLSVTQVAVPASFPTSNGYVTLGFDADGDGYAWSAYASSVDNASGDGWISRATQ